MMAARPEVARLANTMRAGSGRLPVPAGAHAERAAIEPNRTLVACPSASRASITLISTSASSLTALASACLASSP